MTKKIRILTVTPALNMCGGIESYTMNYYRNMTENIVMDFATHDIEDTKYKEEIEKREGKVFLLPKIGLRTLKETLKQIKKILQENQYDIIHCNMANAALFYFYYAKKFGVKVRILHSHQANYADKLSHQIRNIFLIWAGKLMTTHNFACSKLAGDFLFKNKKYYIINNAIDVEKFVYNMETRTRIRKQENIEENELVLANIGRFCNQKNQLFLIEIFNEVVKRYCNAKLYLIGAGELRSKLEEKIKEKGLEDKIIIKEPISNINEFLQATDILVMPSLYEGLPVIGVEAQCADVKCIFSDTITEETKILETTKYEKLSSSAQKWSETIAEVAGNTERTNVKELIKKARFDIKTEAKELEKLYNKIYEEK